MRLGDAIKAPADVLDYEADFSRWLPEGDVVTGAVGTVDAGDVAIDETQFSDSQIKVWLSGGAAGDTGDVEIVATTAGGRTKTVCFRIIVRDC